jgi:site-specific recombinase XerD
MENDLKIQFFIKKSKLVKNDEAPIYIRLKLNDILMEYAIHKSVKPNRWDSVSKRVLGDDTYAEDINTALHDIKENLKRAKTEIEVFKEPLTLENLRNWGKKEKKIDIKIISYFNEHLSKYKELIDLGKFSKNTLKRYNAAKNHLHDFIKDKFKKEDYPISQIDKKFVRNFKFYLQSLGTCKKNNTIIKYLSNVSMIINYALDDDLLDKDPFRGINFEYDDTEIAFLEDDEIDKIRNKNLTIERIDVIRDIYVFCCFTGLAFGDVKHLSREHLKPGIDGNTWIKKNRQKTDVKSMIPLLEPAKKILEKYNYCPDMKKGRLLPVPSNQNMNAYLKEIADLCEIEKNLTTHTARHTFATTVALNNGISMEAVAGMLGHTTTALTRKYARIREKLIAENIKKITDKYI